MKRLFDIFVAAIALLLLLPVLLLVAVFIKIESKGPVFFKQNRVGLHGDDFQIYKFRSMVAGADKQGPYFTQQNDARITKVGGFLRKTSLDELPQFINVLNGSMSLVGPRPNVPAQRGEYTELDWNKRNSVRPGITGLAQAIKRSSATPEERTQLDLEYVDKASLAFDINVMWLTVKLVLSGKGAN